MNGNRAIALSLCGLSLWLIAVWSTAMIISHGFVDQTALPFTFGNLLYVLGPTSAIIAAVQFLDGGRARAYTAFLATFIALRICLAGPRLMETYPTGDPEKEFGVAIILTLVAFGTIQILQKSEHWVKKAWN